VDSFHILDSIKAFPLQCQQVIREVALQHIPPECYLVNNIVISGMGGSALGGRIIASLERQMLKVPIVVSAEYHLPNFVNQKTLVVISSYSGNTEETIFSLAEARARAAQIYIITSGGKLMKMATEQNLPHYIINPLHNPSAQPRLGLGYSILAIITVLARCQLIHPIENLGQLKAYLEEKQTAVNSFQNLAHNLQGKIPILVSSEHLKGAAHAFKNQLNETGKNFAASFDLPELNHHLMEGLAYPGTNTSYLHFVFITSSHYHPEVKKRYPLTMDVVNRQKIPFSHLHLTGPSRFFETLELVQTGEFISFFLSQLNGVDPGPVPWVDYFKDTLSKG
jgi:glucose/mannose-6-phosphate isomerase